jgi:hypothetical protein
MKRPTLLLVAGLIACWLVVRLSLGRGRGGHPPRAPRPASREKHYVTPRQLSAAGGLARRRLAPFTARAHDGRTLRWPDFAPGRPLLLVFLKAGCPCNDDFEPFCRRLHRAYGDRVAFACLIDAGPAAALAHAQRHRCPYPVLADPGKEILARFGAENGGYVMDWKPGVLSFTRKRCLPASGAVKV